MQRQWIGKLGKALSAIRMLVILGALSVIGLLIVQSYWIRNAYASKELEFRNSVCLALDKVARRMAEVNHFVLPEGSVVRTVQSNYFVVNINSNIDANVLQHYLQAELVKHNIKTDFEYGIYDCSSDQVEYAGYVAYNQLAEKSDVINQKGSLPKYDKYPYYFTVRFPQRTNYLVSEIDFWLFTTAIICVVVVFFTYSLVIILRQKRLSEVQRDFINNMTHEFKTPISTISLAAGVLGQPSIKEQQGRLENYARIIKDESLRLNGLVERVLQVAKTDKQGLHLNPEQLCLNDLLRQVADTFDLSGRNGQGQLLLDLPEADVNIEADRLHLTNLLYNLLDNATKYNQRPPELRLRLQKFGNKIKLEVQDNGIGIPKRFQRQVFDRFFRIPTGNIHNVKGFGIGLSYVKLVVKTHRWHIGLLSFPGQGSVFTIWV